MGEVAGVVGGSILANAAGVKLGSMMGGNQNSLGKTLQGNSDYINGVVANMNNILGEGLTQAINSNNQGTNSAISAQQQYLNQALTGSQQASNQGLQQSQALGAPYNLGGLNALDRLQDSLGISRPTMGNAALQGSLFNAANSPEVQQMIQAGQGMGLSPYQNPGTGLFTPLDMNSSQASIQQSLGKDYPIYMNYMNTNNPGAANNLLTSYNNSRQLDSQNRNSLLHYQQNVNAIPGLTNSVNTANAYNAGLFGPSMMRNV